MSCVDAPKVNWEKPANIPGSPICVTDTSTPGTVS